jgi:Fur family zinc uptake transcriptional regulator
MVYPPPFLDYCATLGLKFTSLRKSVLFVLWNSERPLKAYEIVDKLLPVYQNVKPPTVYRVLEYFLDRAMVHKIESIQSYTLCCEPEKQNFLEVLMVCNRCHQVNEVYNLSIQVLVQKLSEEQHFQLGQGAIELRGLCEKCQ